MELTAGKVAVVTGAASGIGLALAERFARAGLDVVLADVEQPALQAASQKIAGLGGKTLAMPTDVSDEAAVNALAAAAVDRFGAVHVVCNNAGVASDADPWFGPTSAWRWVLGVNLWGVIHGIRAFLPVLAAQGEGHIVNTASVAGLIPGVGPIYDATKHAVVAISEDLYQAMNVAMLPIGVSVLCPGWVRTSIYQATRNWPQSLGEVPPPAVTAEIMTPHVQRAIDEGMAPAAVADLVADAIAANRFWVFTDPRFTQIALDRWQRIAEGHNPQTEVDAPGMPPAKQLTAEIQQLLAGRGALWLSGGPGPRLDGGHLTPDDHGSYKWPRSRATSPSRRRSGRRTGPVSPRQGEGQAPERTRRTLVPIERTGRATPLAGAENRYAACLRRGYRGVCGRDVHQNGRAPLPDDGRPRAGTATGPAAWSWLRRLLAS